jgi:hypothetical protein
MTRLVIIFLPFYENMTLVQSSERPMVCTSQDIVRGHYWCLRAVEKKTRKQTLKNEEKEERKKETTHSLVLPY